MTGTFLERLKPKQTEKFQCHFEAPNAVEKLAAEFSQLLLLLNPQLVRNVVIVGVGTDRSTGDCLGPLVGTKLWDNKPDSLSVYGTLDDPVHAGNLSEKLALLRKRHPDSLVVAVDASLGKSSSVGNITISPKPLKPGTGVKKELPLVGHMHFTGVINIAGNMEYFVLQNTRLSFVMHMAERIADSIIEGYNTALSQVKSTEAIICQSKLQAGKHSPTPADFLGNC